MVLNAIALWTTRYIDAAVAQLKHESHEIREKDIARLSRLKHHNPNLLGRHSVTASIPAESASPPLRDPDAAGQSRHRAPDGLTGDVRADDLRGIAGRIAPVPGAVGAMTLATLLHHTLQAAD